MPLVFAIISAIQAMQSGNQGKNGLTQLSSNISKLINPSKKGD